MKVRKLNDSKYKILLFQGSSRDEDTCPDMKSKTAIVVDYVIDKWSHLIDFELIDLSVNQTKKPIIQPCKGCISTAGGYQCHFPCDCYAKGSNKQKDLMKEFDVYEKLKECDAFLIFSPIHWFSLTSQVKALFDRMVCINQTLSVDKAKQLFGVGNVKNSELTGALSKSGEYSELLINHLEGKYCGFYVHGDDGANDYNNKDLPKSYDVVNDSFSDDISNVVKPFINQMKYSGVFVTDDLIQAFYVNKNIDYYSANDKIKSIFYEKADMLITNVINCLDKN